MITCPRCLAESTGTHCWRCHARLPGGARVRQHDLGDATPLALLAPEVREARLAEERAARAAASEPAPRRPDPLQVIEEVLTPAPQPSPRRRRRPRLPAPRTLIAPVLAALFVVGTVAVADAVLHQPRSQQAQAAPAPSTTAVTCAAAAAKELKLPDQAVTISDSKGIPLGAGRLTEGHLDGSQCVYALTTGPLADSDFYEAVTPWGSRVRVERDALRLSGWHTQVTIG